jgi:hypothetical protein
MYKSRTFRAVTTLVRTEPARYVATVRRVLSATPRRLIALGTALAAAVLIFVIILATGMSDARGGFSAISARAAEATTADNLYSTLNDMDAQAANALLVGYQPTAPVPEAVSAQAAAAAYEVDRDSVDFDLQQLGLNPALASQQTTLLDALGSYESCISRALYVDQHATDEAPAAPPTAALDLYKLGLDTLRIRVLPAAAAVRVEDKREIDNSYTGAHDTAVGYTSALVVAGVLLLVFLAAANQYLSRRFRRIVGPALVLAAVTVLSATAFGAGDLGNAAHQYKVAKLNAFDSVSALTTAKAFSYDANANESRWLLILTAAAKDAAPADSTQDGALANSTQHAFFADATQIAGGFDGAVAQPEPYYHALDAATSALTLDTAANTVSGVTLGGYLGSELNNITFDGEAPDAVDAERAFDQYVHDDSTLRNDADSGNTSAAVNFDIGLSKGQSNYDFGRYINDLQKVIDLNQSAFEAAVADGQNSLSAWSWLAYFIGALLMALVGVALFPRLREYR